MGKLTGFMEYERREDPGRDPHDARARLARVPRPPAGDGPQGAGGALHGLRRPLLPHRDAPAGGRVGVPDQQPHPRVERPRLPRAVARGAAAAAQDQQLPRVHGAGLSGALRGLVRARHQRAGGQHQEHRVRHRRQGLRRGVDRRRAAARPDRQDGRRRRLRAGGPGLRGAAQPGRPHGDGLRARRSDRRPPDVRHPAHEAGEADRRPAGEPAGRGGGQVRHRRPHRAELPHRQAARVVRRHRALRRRDGGARSRRRGAEPGRRSLRHGVPAEELQEPARQQLRRRPVHRRQGEERHRDRRRRHRHRLRRNVAAPRLQEPGAVRDPAAPADAARGRQPLAAVAAHLQARLRTGRGRRAVRRRPAPVRDGHQGDRR